MEQVNLHPSVQHMAKAMQEKLEANATKTGWPSESGERGWLHKGCSLEFLMDKLDEEYEELNKAVYDLAYDESGKYDKTDKPALLMAIKEEAADVANIAMMIADKLGAYSEDSK